MVFPRLLQDYLTITAETFPDKKALISGKKSILYSELSYASNNIAFQLNKLGIVKKDRAIILLDNSIETIISLFGVVKAGGVFIIVNSAIKPNSLTYIINDCNAEFIITEKSKALVVKEALINSQSNIKKIWISDSPVEVPEELKGNSFFWHEFDVFNPDYSAVGFKSTPIIDVDLATLIYTSGSTGRSKGVMSNHRSMISAAQSIIEYLENTSNDIVLNVLPLSFDYGLYQVIMSIIFGGTVILEKNFLFIHPLLKKIEKYKVTGFPIVPTIVAMLLNLKDLSKYNFSSLRYISNTGAALPIDHIKRFRELFPSVKIFSMFGLTECKRISYLPPELIDKKPDSVGKPMPNCDIAIVDSNGNQVQNGEIGELIVRGSNVMQGYWNDPVLTDKVYKWNNSHSDHILYTGDFFKQDRDGHLYFLGRKDDMIKCKGERVYPKEIENIIGQIYEVSEVAVIGVDDPVSGTAIIAFIKLYTDKMITTNSIKQYCDRNLESFKMPNDVIILNDLPKTTNGKIDKNTLKETYNLHSANSHLYFGLFN